MLEITPQQLAVLSAQSRRDYVRRLATFLRQEVNELATMPDDALLAETEAQIVKAWNYGLESEQAVATYAVSAALLGADFDTAFLPTAAVLQSRDMSGAAKARWLESWSVELFEQLARG